MLIAQSPLEMKYISSDGSSCFNIIYSGVAKDVPNFLTICSIIYSAFVKGFINSADARGFS
tara:strand:+ start:490 stop:672 length:183 start_codon:yes stop_codon:yes gene_type:complete